jgi:hypothetical protein
MSMTPIRELLTERYGDYNGVGLGLRLSPPDFWLRCSPVRARCPPASVRTLLHSSTCLRRLTWSRTAKATPDAITPPRSASVSHYPDFLEQPGQLRLVQRLYTRAWLSAERPSMPAVRLPSQKPAICCQPSANYGLQDGNVRTCLDLTIEDKPRPI